MGKIASFESENKEQYECYWKGDEVSGVTIGMMGFGDLRKGEKIRLGKNQISEISTKNLTIPDYQRPYAWEERQVETLLNDLKDVIESKKESYLLGSLIFHKNTKDRTLDVVDGQQRLVTLALICAELEQWDDNWTRKQNNIEEGDFFLKEQEFKHSESQKNLKNNFTYIRKWFERNRNEVNKFRELLLNEGNSKIEFVCIVTPNLDDAFIFFDSANSKGKALETYDLIKAYHLSIMNQSGEKSCIKLCAKNFEELCKKTKRVHKLFYELLFPARKWIVMESEFSVPTEITQKYKDKCYEEFCVEIPKWIKEICSGQSKNNMGILQEFEGGKDFFDYIEKYNEIISHIENLDLWERLHKIEGSGNKYLRYLFEIAMMVYFDKYGWKDFGKSLENITKYIYLIRGTQSPIQRKTIPKRAIKILPLIYFSTLEACMHHRLEHMIEIDYINEKWKQDNLSKPFLNALGKHDGITITKEIFFKFLFEGEKNNG